MNIKNGQVLILYSIRRGLIFSVNKTKKKNPDSTRLIHCNFVRINFVMRVSKGMYVIYSNFVQFIFIADSF